MTTSIIFCGTPDFAVPSLQALASDERFKISLVVTQPDKPVGRKKEVTPPPIKVIAEELGLRIFQPEDVNRELPTYVKEHDLHPDYLVVVAYGSILSDEVLGLPRKLPVNVHGSILPRWRGASPIEHAILAGDNETGVTVQVMVQELDAGPILSTYAEPLNPADTATEVRKRLSTIGADLLLATLTQPLKPEPQQSDGVTFCRRLVKEDGQLDRSELTAVELDRHIRALNPWPGVTFDVMGHTVKILEASLDQEQRSIPVSCRDDTTLYIVKLQAPGKNEMYADEWRRGLR